MNVFGYSPRGPDSYTVYLGMRAVTAFAFSLIITYELVYHTVTLGLNPIQLVAVGVVLESMTFLFEIPTGVVADAYSRRLSILIGLFLFGIGFLFEGLVPTLTGVFTAQVLWGIGFTFYSGAGEAWISDEVGEEKAAQAFLRGTQLSQAVSLVGVVTGAFLVGFGMEWPIIIGASIYLATVAVLAWYMTELGYQPLDQQSSQGVLKKMIVPFQDGVRLVKRRPLLSRIFLIGGIIGLYMGGFDRLYTPHLTRNFTLPPLGVMEPVVWFSVLSVIVRLLSLAGTEVVRRHLDVASDASVARLLFLLYSGMIACALVFSLIEWFYVAIACFCISQAVRNTAKPVMLIWVNRNLDSRLRATVLSMFAQSTALGHITGSPIIGWIGTVFSIRTALTLGTLACTAVLPLLSRTMDYSEGEQRQES